MDPVSGWAEIRAYCSATWKYLRAAFKCPLFLLSATMEEASLERILGTAIYFQIFIIDNCFKDTLEIKRDDLSLLYKSSDRPNIYSQRRILTKPVDVM